MQDINTHFVKKILDKLKAVKGFESDRDLCAYLDVKPATLSNWKSRGNMDYELIFTKCVQDSIDLNWLILDSSTDSKNQNESEHKYLLDLLAEKERVIQLQQKYIERLEGEK